jgi:catechol 2,3-dioxygenase-like lactoylglutathione lyase family enzyme
MLEVKSLRTFAINVKDLAQAGQFYTRTLGGEVVRRIDPNEEQRKRGRVKEVDVQLGNFQVHLFDASQGPRRGVPHHTIMITWIEKEKRIQELENAGSKVDNVRDHPDGKGYSLYVTDPDGNIWELWAAA